MKLRKELGLPIFELPPECLNLYIVAIEHMEPDRASELARNTAVTFRLADDLDHRGAAPHDELIERATRVVQHRIDNFGLEPIGQPTEIAERLAECWERNRSGM